MYHLLSLSVACKSRNLESVSCVRCPGRRRIPISLVRLCNTRTPPTHQMLNACKRSRQSDEGRNVSSGTGEGRKGSRVFSHQIAELQIVETCRGHAFR